LRIDWGKYLEATIWDTASHEFGHGVMATEDEVVGQHLGISPEADIVEELKAETVGMRLLRED